MSALPAPSADASAHSQHLARLIAEDIATAGGWISFARFMELALHAPGLGYYSAGARKFGTAGDFVTAPELGDVFARTLARQAAQCLRAGLSDILELGAGSGRLASDLLRVLAANECLPRRYLILETSAELRERQRSLLQQETPDFVRHIVWLNELPASLEAFVFGNEVLDVLPVHLVATRDGGIVERGVTAGNGEFKWSARPASGLLFEAANELELPPGYATEIHLAAQAYVRTLAQHLTRGVILFVDYGFPAHEYYHPQRNGGTLMCHYRQHSHDDPLCLVGLQDITAHIDFSAIAHVAMDSGLDLLGYTNQAQFLINCGVADVLTAVPADQASAYLPLAAQAQKLLSPAEMGELFKVIAVGKACPAALLGFASGDKRHTL